METTINIKIRRQKGPNDHPYYQTFSYTGPDDATIAVVLEYLNYNDDLFDIDGNPAERIKWECSCQQKLCGACAMVIDGVPALACSLKLKDLKQNTVVIEPLKKFPLIADLKVNRNAIAQAMVDAHMWLEDAAYYDEKLHRNQYLAAKCMKCGLCLEVCPNYGAGGRFLGGAMASEAYLACTQSASGEHMKRIKAEYRKHFADGCSKSFACEKICPAGIHILSMICELNRR